MLQLVCCDLAIVVGVNTVKSYLDTPELLFLQLEAAHKADNHLLERIVRAEFLEVPADAVE